VMPHRETAMADQPTPEKPGGTGDWHGLPYDVRPPTLARNRSRYWNPEDGRFFTPKVFGAGWTVNVHWVIHPLRYVRRRRQGRPGA